MTSDRDTNGEFRPLVVRITTAALLLLISLIAAWRVHVAIVQHEQSRFDEEVRRVESAVQERMTAYVQVLRGGLGLFHVAGAVDLEQWLRYCATLQLAERYPGFKALSFAAAVKTEDLPAFAERVRTWPIPAGMEHPERLREYTIRSNVATFSPQATHSPITYVSPLIPVNTRVLGIDMMQEPMRRAAMERAADSGKVVLSPLLNLVGQDDGKVGFIAFLAVRRDGVLVGWLTAAFLAHDFMHGLLGSGPSALEFAVYDGTEAGAGLLYSTTGINSAGKPLPLSTEHAPTRAHVADVELPGRTWQLRFVAPPDFSPRTDRLAPWLIVIGGLLATSLYYMTSLAAARMRVVTTRVAAQNDQLQRQVVERDRTEVELRSLNRQLDEASRAKDAFLATMSHEIRTPMNAVIGMTGILRDTALDAEQREFVEIVRVSGEHLLMLINDVLDFSKIEAGKLELEEMTFDLRACVEEALDLVAAKAAEKRLELAVDAAADLPASVLGDVGRVRQVLLNLLSNAVKFTEHGEVIVELSAQRMDDGRHTISAAVRDTGPGIPAAKMDRLFQSFTQVDASTTRRYGGTGLGLVISKRLAEHMGGTITVSSESGVGSTFRFTFVAAEAPDPPATPATTAILTGARVLVVDDNPAHLRILAARMTACGGQERSTRSPQEALAWVRDGEKFDLAVIDMQMPEMDGLALAAALRQAPGAATLPVILLSSLGTTRAEANARGVELTATLSKPVKHAQLLAALAAARAPARTGPTPPRPAAEADDGLVRVAPMRILMADDNTFNQRVAALMLRKLGQPCDVVANGLEAVDAVRERGYAVVFMDMQMPELDGLEATRRIRATLPPERQPYVIAMTANALKGDRETCIDAGMDDYLSKPIRREEVAAALARAADRQPHA